MGGGGVKKLVALFKTYRGGEWFGASLESVRPHCAGAVVVSADGPWKSAGAGAAAPENCREPLAQFRAKHPDFPLAEVRPGVRQDTEEQYRVGLALVKALHGPDVGVLIVDTDEVWDGPSLEALRRDMTDDRRAQFFRSGIRTYLRSPLYRVAPQEQARPVVGLSGPNVPTGKSRFSNLPELGKGDQVRDVANCTMHHFGYVRLDVGEIAGKLSNTSAQDGTKVRPRWKETVWDSLPAGTNLHPTPRYERCWARVEEVTAADLPAAAVESPTFWMTLAHHRGGVPSSYLLADDQAWREFAERDLAGIETTAPPGLALCLSAALTSVNGGRTGQDEALFLTPRLRMSFRETMQLAEHARGLGVGARALEIGSGLGGSMAVIGCCARAGTELFAVDPFELYDEQNATLSRGLRVGTAKDFHETIAGCKVKAILLTLSSEAAVWRWNNGDGQPLDLVLVDGNHSYQHAKFDLDAWWPHLRPGGTLLLHDLSGRFPGVVRAAREFEEAVGQTFSLPYRSSLAWMKKGV